MRPFSAHFDRQARLVLVQLAKQLKVCAAGKAARLVHAVAYVVMRECTRRSRLAGSAGEAAEGVVQPANAGASLGAQTVCDGRL